MLLGGLLRADGMPSANVISDPMLNDLRAKLGVRSCSGFTTETGLTESDILDMQLKARMVEIAGSVITLIDGSKFGKLGLAPFARVDQVAHIFSDGSITPEWIEQVRRAGVPLTVCDEQPASAFAPFDQDDRQYRIGFANLTERMPFALQVRLGARAGRDHSKKTSNC